MSKDKKNDVSGVGEDIEVAVSRTEAFIEKNQKQLIYAVLAVVVIVSAFILFNRYHLAPQETEAQNQMAKAQVYFAQDSFKLAFTGDGLDAKGFKRIIEDYGLTESANLAQAYAGICLYKMGEYKKAITYLEDFDGNGDVNFTPTINGLIGDAFVELNETDKALSYFAKAYKLENKMLSPVFLKKAALLHESKGEFDKAIALYTEIKDKYFDSAIARDIDKYIERASLSK